MVFRHSTGNPRKITNNQQRHALRFHPIPAASPRKTRIVPQTEPFANPTDSPPSPPFAEPSAPLTAGNLESSAMIPPDSPLLTILDQRLFFIIGAPRSGTTLLQTILSSHSRIFIPPETEFFMRFAPQLDAAAASGDNLKWQKALRNWFRSVRWIDQQIDSEQFLQHLAHRKKSAREAFRTLIELHAVHANVSRIGEKSPHHCRHVQTIRKMFPQAKFIHLYRDPRDVVASRLTMPWSDGSHLAIAREWDRIAQQHFRDTRGLPPSTYTSVRFETLVTESQTEIEVRRLCKFLGESFEHRMLNRADSRDHLPEAANQPAFTDREKPWKIRASAPITNSRIGTFKNLLSPRKVAGIERICARSMAQLQYTSLSDHKSRLMWKICDAADYASDFISSIGRSAAKRFRFVKRASDSKAR